MTVANRHAPKGLAGPSVGVGFKPEHFEAILDARPALGFFEVHAENYMGARRRAASPPRCDPRAIPAVPARRRPFDRLSRTARPRPSQTAGRGRQAIRADPCFRAPRLVDPRGRVPQRSPAPALHERNSRTGLGAYRRGSERAWPDDAARKSFHLCRVRRKHVGRDRFPARDCAADRLRPPARRQQRVRERRQPRLRSRAFISQTFPFRRSARSISRATPRTATTPACRSSSTPTIRRFATKCGPFTSRRSAGSGPRRR